MTNNDMLVSDVQLSDSVIHASIVFQILFPFRLLQNIVDFHITKYVSVEPNEIFDNFDLPKHTSQWFDLIRIHCRNVRATEV